MSQSTNENALLAKSALLDQVELALNEARRHLTADLLMCLAIDMMKKSLDIDPVAASQIGALRADDDLKNLLINMQEVFTNKPGRISSQTESIIDNLSDEDRVVMMTHFETIKELANAYVIATVENESKH